MNLKKYILLIGFLIFICFPAVNTVINILPDTESSENRRLKKFKEIFEFEAEEVSDFLDQYLIDHLSIRNRMIKFYNQLNIFVFRSSPVSIKAVVGKNGWFFMAGEEIKTYNGTELFSENELMEFKDEMLRRQKIIESYGGKMLFAIVPNKSNIYPEYMPEHIVKANNVGYGKQLLKYLQENNLPVIDLYSPLTEAKKFNETYYHTDNHWNDYGAFVASNVILEEITKYFPGVNVLDLNSYPIKKEKEKPGNIAKMFSIENETVEYNYIPTPEIGFKSTEKKLNKYKAPEGFVYAEEFEFTRYRNNDSLPSVLIIRDSFGKKPFPYIAEQSKKCISIYDAWNYGLNEEIIRGEKPDIVLYLVIESNLKNIMKYRKKEK